MILIFSALLKGSMKAFALAQASETMPKSTEIFYQCSSTQELAISQGHDVRLLTISVLQKSSNERGVGGSRVARRPGPRDCSKGHESSLGPHDGQRAENRQKERRAEATNDSKECRFLAGVVTKYLSSAL